MLSELKPYIMAIVFSPTLLLLGIAFGLWLSRKKPKRFLHVRKARGALWERAMKHPVDVHVGKQIRHQRWMVGMTQQQLAEKVGIKFQQVQKYETGMNRVSASRLWDIAETLGVSIGFFFEGANGEKAAPTDLMADKEAVELVRSYFAIPQEQRRRLFELAKVLSEAA